MGEGLYVDEKKEISYPKMVIPEQFYSNGVDDRPSNYGEILDAKRDADAKMLDDIDSRVKGGRELSKSDLTFLYEVGSWIENSYLQHDPRVKEIIGGRDLQGMNSLLRGHVFQRDPRIREIIDGRDLRKDLCVIFDCQPEQISIEDEEVRDDTVVYVAKEHSYDGFYRSRVKNWPKIPPNIYEYFPDTRVSFAKPGEFKFKQFAGVDVDRNKGRRDYTLNPDCNGIDFDEAKFFVPDLSSFVGRTVAEVADYVVETYSEKYIVADESCVRWLNQAYAGSRIPASLQDPNINFFCVGSLLCSSSGTWTVMDDKSARKHMALSWLGSKWSGKDRILLVER